MDPVVLAAMARWPNVPDVYGWLSLTARGQWRLRGEPIGNDALREFIGRNYAADERGRWYFQNGPQRVFVALELAPRVYRVQADGSLRDHTGPVPCRLQAAALVDGSVFVLLTDLGAGNIDDHDVGRFLGALVDERGLPLAEAALERALAEGRAGVAGESCGLAGTTQPLRRLGAAELGAAFGFDPRPAPA